MIGILHIEIVAWKTVDQKYVSAIKYCRKVHAVS